jgi:HK97 family phage prohead protease
MNLQKKVFIGNIKSIDEKEGTLTAAISVDTIDRMGEILDPNGVDLKNYRKNPVVLWAHDYARPPIGKALWVKREGNSVLSKVKFADTEFAQEIFSLYKGGFLNAFSVGFNPKEWDDGDAKKGINRVFTKWELMEYSAVPVPANPSALALAMQKGILKNNELIRDFDQEELVQEFNHEVKSDDNAGTDKVVEEQKELVNKPDEVYQDVITENKSLQEEIEKYRKENEELRYKLFISLKQNQLSLSEITATTLRQEIGEEVRRVIRKAQGKID